MAEVSEPHTADLSTRYRLEGAQSERERIIKLLEQDVCPDWTITCCDGACAAYKDAIALIKGEQK